MSTRADHLNVTHQSRQASKTGDLERRLAALERQQAAGIQRAFSADPSEFVALEPADVMPPEPLLQISVPSEDSILLVDWAAEARATGPSPRMILKAMLNPDDAPGTEPGYAFGNWFITSSSYKQLSPVVVPADLSTEYGPQYFTHRTLEVVTGQDLADNGLTIPGTHYVGFEHGYNNAGTVTYSRDRRLRVIVI